MPLILRCTTRKIKWEQQEETNSIKQYKMFTHSYLQWGEKERFQLTTTEVRLISNRLLLTNSNESRGIRGASPSDGSLLPLHPRFYPLFAAPGVRFF